MMLKPSYLSLGSDFHKTSYIAKFSNPQLLLWNEPLAKALKLKDADRQKHSMIFTSGTSDNAIEYPSLAYSGHQFGHFNPSLGDGRAHLLAEIEDNDGELWELQSKGSGPTVFSRGGDGLCGLGPALREYIMSEALFSLGVPTSRSLAVIDTGDYVYRQDGRTKGAVVTRVARSHIRIGTFQYFASRADHDNLKKLADYTIKRHYSDHAAGGEKLNDYVALLDQFMDKQIHLVCEWMRIGFIHGVMNTDNVTLSGDTIDFGPCAMMERYDPEAVFSSIDQHHRYAFSSQPDIAYWNTLRFAECLIPLVSEDHDEAIEQLGSVMTQFETRFKAAHSAMLHRKFGLAKTSEASEQFIQSFMLAMHELKLDFTNTFVSLGDFLADKKSDLAPALQTLAQNASSVLKDSDPSISASANPVVIPRNHLVEAAISDCLNGSLNTAKALIEATNTPYAEHLKHSTFTNAAQDGDVHYRTFCGT